MLATKDLPAESEQMETEEIPGFMEPLAETKKKIVSKIKSVYQRKMYDKRLENLSEFTPWLTSSKKSPTLAHCVACEKDLLGGKPELTRHAATEKHRNNLVNIGWVKPDKSMKQKVYNCKMYSNEWEKVPELKDWLKPSKKDIYHAYCRACDKDLSAGKGELMKHSAAKKHLDAMKNLILVDKRDKPIWSSDSEVELEDSQEDVIVPDMLQSSSDDDDVDEENSSFSDESSSSSSLSSSAESCPPDLSPSPPTPDPEPENDNPPENTSNNNDIVEIDNDVDLFTFMFNNDSSSSDSSLNSDDNLNVIKSKKDRSSDTSFTVLNESLENVKKPDIKNPVKRSSKYVRKRPIDQPKKYPKQFVDMPEYKGWFMQSEKSKFYAFCRACKKDLSAGKCELKRHLEGNKHIQAANAIKTKHDVDLVESNNEFDTLEKAARTAEIKIVEFAGENGMLVKPGCFESFVRLLKSIVTDSEIFDNISMERIMSLADGVRQTQLHYEVEYLEDEFDSEFD